MIELSQTFTAVSSDTKDEWAKLCDWLKHDNFSVMGYIKFAWEDSDTSEFISTIEDSGLGIISPVYIEKTTNNLSNVLTAQLWKRRHSEFPFSLDRIHFKSPVLHYENMMMLSIKIPDEKLGILRTCISCTAHQQFTSCKETSKHHLILPNNANLVFQKTQHDRGTDADYDCK
jgi:Bacterial NAD-glutamate dehydrogenase.